MVFVGESSWNDIFLFSTLVNHVEFLTADSESGIEGKYLHSIGWIPSWTPDFRHSMSCFVFLFREALPHMTAVMYVWRQSSCVCNCNMSYIWFDLECVHMCIHTHLCKCTNVTTNFDVQPCFLVTCPIDGKLWAEQEIPDIWVWPSETCCTFFPCAFLRFSLNNPYLLGYMRYYEASWPYLIK